ALVTEVQAEEQKLGGPNSQQYKDYVKTLGDDLKQSGVLPELSLDWAKANSQTLINDSNADGKISKDGIDNYLKSANPGEFGATGVDPANALFANQFKGMYDKLGGASDNLSTDDLSKDFSTAQSVYQQGDFIKTFLGNKNAPTALFDLIDTAQHGGSPDGWISKNDVNAFLDNKNRDEILKSMGFTDQQQEDIDNGLRNWSKNWDSDALKSMQKDGNIGRTELANAFGYGSIEDLSTAVQGNKFHTAPTQPAGS
ncbi:MAG TPA: hypothetical protein V6C72_01970, partial [Chroococcales cyanobacterium]